ncbi:MAG TPA: hypothetical protein VFT65_09675, partial [Candidatus Angelobacter sp.]|nr:hypothetical protein [Candidatus Angelobacter sp.]
MSLLSGFRFHRTRVFFRQFFIFSLFVAAAISAYGKAAPATAIVLFDGPQGAAYIQISGAMLNGKAELRICDGVAKFDKRAYDNLLRTQLTGAASLERDASGVLNLTVDGKQICVVPSSLKFDKNAELTPAQAADQAVIQGVPVSASSTEGVLPEFKPGVRLVFVPAPDADLAEYLRTQRANSAAEWQDFLRRFPTSAHAAEARSALADLHQRAAEAAFARYQDQSSTHKADLALLKQASSQAQIAARIAPGSRPVANLLESIGRELDRLLEPDRTSLQAYRQALQNHGAGYARLVAARQHVAQLIEVRPDYVPVINLQRDIAGEEQKLESILANAEALVAGRRYDDAVASLEPYSSFAGEAPRIEAVLDADYGYHLSQGKAFLEHQDWDAATREFRRALVLRKDSREAANGLNQAETQLAAAQNQRAANLAVLQSDEFAGKGDFIEAYNTLVALPETQRALVAPQMAALSRNYVTAASRRAQKLQETHLPIKSRADEDAIRQAGEMLDRANAIAGDPALKLKRDFLFGKLSSFYLDQAKKHFDKPVGSGVGIGWLFLQEAQRYDADIGMIKDQVKDLMAANANIYQRRARLSVGIVIRDQTSRQGSVGFADQMADAVA